VSGPASSSPTSFPLSIPALALAHSDEHVSSAAIRSRKPRYPIWQGTNSTLRLEPTWGDPDVLLGIVAALAPANGPTLSGMCTMASASAKNLQVIRNAAAHLNSQTTAEVTKRSSSYTTFSMTHPSQALFWVGTASGMYLLSEGVDALKIAAMFAIM
jgi:hypothetical protein